MASAMLTENNQEITHEKVVPPVLSPKWPKDISNIQTHVAQTNRRDEERYINEGFAVPHANASLGIPAEKFKRMYHERYGPGSYRVLTNTEYAYDRDVLTQALKDGGHVLPSEEKTSDGKTGDDLKLHPDAAARKHLSEFTSGSLERIHNSLLDSSEKILDPLGDCFDTDKFGKVIGIKLPQYTTNNPSFDQQADIIKSFCYVSFQSQPIAYTHEPRQTEDKFMCLDGERWKWCYAPSGEGEPSKYLVGSYRYLKEPISSDEAEIEFWMKRRITSETNVRWKINKCTLGNLYATSMDAFQSVQIGIFLEQCMGILKKGGKRNLDIQREFFKGLMKMAKIAPACFLTPIEYYQGKLGELLEQARAAVESEVC